MLSRRLFANCALCAGLGIIATGARAQGPGFTRTVMRRADFPGDAMATIQVLVDIEPRTLIARHTHPGVETGYLIEGGGVLGVQGEPDRTIEPGGTFQIPNSVPHSLRNGDQRSRVLAVYVVDKSKPLASPAPE